MKSKGIRIQDINEKIGVGLVDFTEILKEIQNGDEFYWSILDLEAIGNLGDGKSLPLFEKQIEESKDGLVIDWKELNSLISKLKQIINVTLIGCRNKKLLKRSEEDQEMYETFDIVIEMIDSSFWEVFSNDEKLIKRLSNKFKKIKFLEPNFQDKYH